MTIRIGLVDDQALVRSGFAMVLSVEPDMEVVGQAADGRAGLDLARRDDVDIVLMDVQMPVMDGIESTLQIVREDLAKVIILTTFDRDDYLFAALEAGASGFLLKNADPDELVAAIHAVAEGHALLAPELTVRVIQRLVQGKQDQAPAGGAGPGEGSPPPPAAAHPVEALTARERDVLALMAEGMSNAEIATRLFVGESTVKTHVSHVLAKIGARDRVQAVVYAHRAGMTTRP
ncbi:response regulator transcription factor [Ruania suaedae]|uniref:response regulator n=1 Tax=Ruania suaedae TaxID=2897774 RepID=UPI001E477B85|nr:response regulator transcription factor [Ruania suaedae]UFU04494.1 response regulator transcription factor [Ruania suaedae]